MAGMPVMKFKQKTPPKVGEDADNMTRVANNGTTPSMPDRDGPSTRKQSSKKMPTTAKSKMKGPDIKGMKKSIGRMGMF